MVPLAVVVAAWVPKKAMRTSIRRATATVHIIVSRAIFRMDTGFYIGMVSWALLRVLKKRPRPLGVYIYRSSHEPWPKVFMSSLVAL